MLNTTNFKYTNIISAVFICLFLYLLSFLFSITANAQNQRGITVFPSIHYIDLATEAPEYDLTYINTTKADINLKLSAQDFNGVDENYKINFLDKKDSANYKYSLSSWLTFENETIQLRPGEEKTIKIFVDKDRITKGGHYASIMAEIQQPDTREQVDVKGILSSLLFVRASTGQEVERGKIASFRPDRDLLKFPENVITRFENSGNVHVIPYGLIEVKDFRGKLVAKGIFNEDSLDALPESIRRYETKLVKEGFLLPGLYTAEISLHFGKTNQRVSADVRFFSEGSVPLIPVILIIVILSALLFVLTRRAKKSVAQNPNIESRKTKQFKNQKKNQ